MILAKIAVHTSNQLAELGFALAAIAGGVLALAAVLSSVRRPLAIGSPLSACDHRHPLGTFGVPH